MMACLSHALPLLLLATAVLAIPSWFTLSPYAPSSIQCPSGNLLRPATGLSSQEISWVQQRQLQANNNFGAWIQGFNTGQATNNTFNTSQLPVVALASSGGGLRALLSGAGVVQAFDNRDINTSVSGLYQSLTYHSGVSGGAWLLTSLAGNNWPTISTLLNKWYTAFDNSIFLPDSVLAGTAYAQISIDLAAKSLAGYEPGLVDVYGRNLGYQLLNGNDGGVSDTLSGVTTSSNFASHSVPFPIMTALGVESSLMQSAPWICISGFPSSTQYEFHPYEFGSWDTGVGAFTPTQFLGSQLNNGMPLNYPSGMCMEGFDNLGFIAATSSNVFNFLCNQVPNTNLYTGDAWANLINTCIAITNVLHISTLYDEYAVYPNPYFNSSLVDATIAGSNNLYLIDGSWGDGSLVGGQNVPLWPLIQPARAMDVIIANDNSADTADGWPNGTALYDTYNGAQAANLTKMPTIPPPDVFVSQGLNKRAVFFGCGEPQAATIIYLPNNNYTFLSNTSAFDLQYSPSEVTGMIQNGNAIATQNGTTDWPQCLACGMMSKMNNGSNSSLPVGCTACLADYCWSGNMTATNSTTGGNGTLSGNTTAEMGLHVAKMQPRWGQWHKHA